MFSYLTEDVILFVDLPDVVQELNYNYWTSLSRHGCVGKIKNCFSKEKKPEAAFPEYDSYFWRMFDRTSAGGACVALQTLPFGVDQSFGEAKVERYPLGPVFVNCDQLNYFACEAEGVKSKFVDETEITVKTKNAHSVKESILMLKF